MRFLRFLIYVASILCFSAMVAGYFGFVHPAFDSFSAFRVHFAALTLGSGLLLALVGGRLGGLSIAAAATVVTYATVAPNLTEAQAESGSGAQYRLLQINVRFNNPTPKELLKLIARTRPDVITVQEVTSRWRAEFATIKSAYPYQLYCAAHRKIGDVAILSRRPFVEAETNYCGQGESIAIQSVTFGGQTVAVASVHLLWPWPHRQPQQVADMKPILETLGASDQPVLLAGDLNAPRWSHTARSMAAYSKTSLEDFRGGTWLAFEFPASWTKWFGLAIDNVFSAGVEIRSIESQTNVGSDHLPMLIEFSIPVRDQEESPEPAVGVV
jgi:endonuclease/exonuclease/phosphatase (EEP) superfamily protein YafD